MESMISVISDLRKIDTIIGNGKIELPQIVVVGSQSSGKSSVLEGIVGWDFLPRGTGIVTRRPLVLNLVNVPEDDPRREQTGLSCDWATFDHIPGENFTNFDNVRNEIERDTLKVAGDSKNISPNPIYLTIYSSKVIDLSLVDLPGAIRFLLPNQSDTIKDDIEKMIGTYISSPKSLILAVTPANQDAAVSDALYYAKKYDPEGKRTLCVLTKIDIMDRGTNAYDMLSGKTIPVKLGIIGVRNRSQEEIANNQSIEECLKKEERFFSANYPSIAEKNGMPFLRKQMNKLLEAHIAENLPGLRDTINSMANQQNEILLTFGNAPDEASSKAVTNKVIRNFVKVFKTSLNGMQEDIEVTKLIGGACINYAFKNFSSFKDIKPDDGLTDEVVINALRNSHGTRVPMFIPEHCFVQLCIRQIKRLKEPCVAFVDTIKNVLLENVDYCTGKIVEQEKNRFPRLYRRINKVACDTVNDRLQPTKEFVEKIVNMQLNYINIRHPEFVMQQQRSVKNFKENQQTNTSGSKENVSPEANNNHQEVGKRQPLPQEPRQNAGLQNNTVMSKPLPPPHSSSTNTSPPCYANSDRSQQHQPGNKVKAEQQPFTAIQKSAALSNSSSESLSSDPEYVIEEFLPPPKAHSTPKYDKDELEDCKTLKKLVIQYFQIVCKTLQFELPKAIMMELVNHVKDNIHEELEQKISVFGDVVKELTRENEAITQKREQTFAKLEELEKAKAILQKVAESSDI